MRYFEIVRATRLGETIIAFDDIKAAKLMTHDKPAKTSKHWHPFAISREL
jgi:hypothetical protein